MYQRKALEAKSAREYEEAQDGIERLRMSASTSINPSEIKAKLDENPSISCLLMLVILLVGAALFMAGMGVLL